MENEIIEIEVEDNSPSMMDMLAGQGNEQMRHEYAGNVRQFAAEKNEKTQALVKEARKVLIQEEAQRLIDMDEVIQESLSAPNNPALFLSMKLIRLPVHGRGVTDPMFRGKVFNGIFCRL